MRKKVVALALGGGTARGLANIGVIKVLVENKIPINLISGTSMGAIVGAFYAKNLNILEVEELALKNSGWRMLNMIDPFFRIGLIRGLKVEKFLKSYLGDIFISDLKLPFVAIATNLETGEPYYFNRGNLISAIRASISLPLVFTPVHYNNMILVDGGLTEPVPVNAALNSGADVVIAVNLDSYKNLKEKLEKPSIRKVASRSTKIITYQISKINVDRADVVIAPNIDYFRSGDFFHVKEFISEGERAAKKALPEILDVLKKNKIKQV
jgi:NTE family protein